MTVCDTYLISTLYVIHLQTFDSWAINKWRHTILDNFCPPPHTICCITALVFSSQNHWHPATIYGRPKNNYSKYSNSILISSSFGFVASFVTIINILDAPKKMLKQMSCKCTRGLLYIGSTFSSLFHAVAYRIRTNGFDYYIFGIKSFFECTSA